MNFDFEHCLSISFFSPVSLSLSLYIYIYISVHQSINTSALKPIYENTIIEIYILRILCPGYDCKLNQLSLQFWREQSSCFVAITRRSTLTWPDTTGSVLCHRSIRYVVRKLYLHLEYFIRLDYDFLFNGISTVIGYLMPKLFF